jgi:hypothetical protein
LRDNFLLLSAALEMLLGILINAEYYDRHNVEIVKVLKKLCKGEEEIAPRHTESQEKTHHE